MLTRQISLQQSANIIARGIISGTDGSNKIVRLTPVVFLVLAVKFSGVPWSYYCGIT